MIKLQFDGYTVTLVVPEKAEDFLKKLELKELTADKQQEQKDYDSDMVNSFYDQYYDE